MHAVNEMTKHKHIVLQTSELYTSFKQDILK